MSVLGGDERYKDEVSISLVPEVVSECSLVARKGRTGSCLSDDAIKFLSSRSGIKINVPDDVKELRRRYGVKKDKDLLVHLPQEMSKKEEIFFKIDGPSGVSLLSNDDIDTIMKQWTMAFPRFYAYNFNMLDYDKYSFRNGRVVKGPDTLLSVDPEELFKKYDSCGCIINSDVYHGAGKHWMALYADTKNKTVEFFNSSGRSPVPEWTSWLERARRGMAASRGFRYEDIKVLTGHRVQQYSMTECGVYSLFYIWARLNGTPQEYFENNPIHDELMFEFRAHLYNGYLDNKVWNFDQFKKGTNVRWDSSGGHREGE